jgi:hypothetical protein
MIQIFTPTTGESCQEAFWYHGKQIASVTMPDGTIFSLESAGEIQCDIREIKHKGVDRLPISDDWKWRTCKGTQAVDFASAQGMTDEDLENEELIVFSLNNWFAIRKLEPNTTEGADDDFAIVHTYTDGIQELVGILMQA